MRHSLIICLLSLMVVTGCKKEEFVPIERERTALHIVGAAIIPASYDLNLDYFNVGTTVIDSFFYMRNWPTQGYADLESAGTEIDEFDNGKLFFTGTRENALGEIDTVFAQTDIQLLPNASASMFMYNDSGELKMSLIPDVLPVVADTMAAFRFANFNENFPSVSLQFQVTGSLISGVGFTTASGFSGLETPGNYVVDVIDDANGAIIATVGNVSLQAGKVYTYYLTGTLNSPNLGSYWH